MTPPDTKPEIASSLSRIWTGGETRYGVTEQEFGYRVETIIQRLKAKTATLDEAEAIGLLNGADLCLAIACGKGDERAWRDFDTAYKAMMLAAARKLTGDASDAEEIVQSVYGELYGVRNSGAVGQAKIGLYSGRGSLGGWLRAVVYQAFIDRQRIDSRLTQTEDEAEFERLANANPSSPTSVEDRPDKSLEEKDGLRLRSLVTEALREVLQSLENRERLVVGFYYVNGATLKEIGGILGAHEGTVSRWLSRIQSDLKKKVIEVLRRKGLGDREIEESLVQGLKIDFDLRASIGSKEAASERGP